MGTQYAIPPPVRWCQRELRIVSPFFAVIAVASAVAAQPAATPPAPGVPGHWTIVTGETVSPGRDAVSVEMGWPGITAGYLRGLSENIDVGVKFDLLYGLENTTGSKFGLGLDVPLRLVVSRKDNILLGMHVDPGARVYTNSGSTDFVIRFPVGGILAIQATPEVRIAAAVDLMLGLQIPHTMYMEIGPLFGFALEYMVDKNLLVGLNTRFGPQFYTLSGSGTDFAFTTQIVVGYRL
jgi:hypothetical protein